MFGRNKQQSENERQLKLMNIIKTLDKLAEGGFLYMDDKDSRVVVSTTVASLYMGTKDKFHNFMQHISMWMNFERSRKLMAKYTREELNNMEKPPLPEEKLIDFCIVTATGEPIVVGNYKDKHLNMMSYSEVKSKIADEEDN